MTLEPNHRGQVTLPCWYSDENNRRVSYPYWQKLYLECEVEPSPSINVWWGEMSRVNAALKPYCARLRTPKTYPYYIRFETPADATLFLLKYS